MSGIHFTTFEPFRFGSRRPLGEKQTSDLARFFNRPATAAGSVLEGRASVFRHTMDGVGPVVIKFYRRGGFISRFIKKTYLRIGKTRGQREFEMLERVRRLGVRAPRPVAFAHRGSLLYQCWLVTVEVQQHRTLAHLSREDPGQATLLADAVATEVNRLIQHHIHHVDLHPGNVLVDLQQRIYLIDFDKARHTQRETKILRLRYFKRWQRAVAKHRLPAEISTAFKKALFQ